MANLFEEIQEQMNRCRELVKEYESIGPAGAIGAALIKQDIANGERALASHDVVEMVRAYKALEGCE